MKNPKIIFTVDEFIRELQSGSEHVIMWDDVSELKEERHQSYLRELKKHNNFFEQFLKESRHLSWRFIF